MLNSSHKRWALLKYLKLFLRGTYALSVGFKNEIFTKKRFPVLKQKLTEFCHEIC